MPSAHLFDMEAAISVARRLFLSETGAAIREREEHPDMDLPYVRFDEVPRDPSPVTESRLPEPEQENSSTENEAQRPAAPPTIVMPAAAPDARTVVFDSWEQCIIWCNQVTGASSSFVIDSQGFIIANYGRIPPEGLDGLGAELCYAVEMLSKISPGFGKVAWVDLDYDNSRIVGYQVRNAAEESFILGFLSPNANYFSQKITISRAISNSITNMI